MQYVTRDTPLGLPDHGKPTTLMQRQSSSRRFKVSKPYIQTLKPYQSASLKSSALTAISSVPSLVVLPPMKPDACTKTQLSTPHFLLSSSPRSPLHGSGRGSLGVSGCGWCGREMWATTDMHTCTYTFTHMHTCTHTHAQRKALINHMQWTEPHTTPP